MRLVVSLVTTGLCLWATAAARAHFIWVVASTGPDGIPVAHVYFAEQPRPGETDLIEKIRRVRLVHRTEGQPPKALHLEPHVTGETAALRGTMPYQAFGVLEAELKYGVITRGDKPLLLHYYAKCLDSEAPAALAHSPDLALDILPHSDKEGLQLQVLWRGKPATDVQLLALDPARKQTELKLDAEGRTRIAAPLGGTWAFRARHVERTDGKENGQRYEQVLHYCTLVLAFAQAPSNSTPSAADLLRQARSARATWLNFPGFESDVAIHEAGKLHRGRIRVAASGEFELRDIQLPADSRVQAALRSLISHRLGNGEDNEDVSFTDEHTDHPLGRLVKLNYDSQMASTYRIAGDVIREVNRRTDDGRFTISVLNVYRNSQGKYLPQTYTVSFWDKDGALQSASTVEDKWVRVGEFDLPMSHHAVTTGKNVHANLRLEFTNHRLLP